MSYRPEDRAVEASTNRWMLWGLVLLALFVLAFPIYRILQPARLEAAHAELQESLTTEGEEIFTANCAQCHGGEATGGIGPALNSEQFQSTVSDRQMHQLISTGVPGTLMAAYSVDFGGILTQQQITATVAYIRSFKETAPDFPEWQMPLAQTDLSGEELFNMACSYCHGIDLEGNIGPALGAGSDLVEENDAFIERTIREGSGEMPSFDRVFTDEQIASIIDYIREVQNG